MFKRFNRWYDALKEPKRFLFFMFVLMGWIVLLQFPPFSVIHIVGVIWMCVTVVIALSRLR